MAQTQKKKSSTKETVEENPVESKKSETAAKTVEEADKMMDKIDEILNEFDAAEFVASYVQKGGE